MSEKSERSVCPHCETKFTSEDVSAYQERKRIDKEFREIHADDLAKISKKRNILFYGSALSTLLSLIVGLYLAFEEPSAFSNFFFDYILKVTSFGGFIGVLTGGFWSGILKRKKLFKNFKDSRKKEVQNLIH